MGLDMYIYRKSKGEQVAYWRKANAVLSWLNRHIEKEEDDIENCKEYYIDKELLEELKRDCVKVLSKPELVNKEIEVEQYDYEHHGRIKVKRIIEVLKDSSLAEELLPTEEGYFYGSTIYDERYLDDLRNTIEQIDKILETTDFNTQNLYFHAWW